MSQLPLLRSDMLRSLAAPNEALGQIFTPPAVVEFILDQAGFVPSATLLDSPLLEPACGRGAFLLAAARRLAEAVEADARNQSPKARAQHLAAVLVRNLWGIDIDPGAVRASQEALRSFVAERTGRAAPEGLFARNILAQDFLISDEPIILPPVANGSLRFIVGNPPYVPTTDLTAAHKAALRNRFSTASGRIDLYGLFIEKAINLLPEKGTLSFIVPDKLLHSQTARPLRTFMLRAGSLRTLACFESHKVFQDADTVPCVFVFERAKRNAGYFRAIDCEYRNGAEPVHIAMHRNDRLSTSRLEARAWKTRSDELEEVAEAVSGSHPKLGQVATRISAGLATGRDSIYVVGADVAKTLDPELLRPAIRGRDIAPLKAQNSGLFMILPFTFSGRRAKLIDIREFPRTYKYLRKHRAQLEARHCVRTWGKAWFDIHDPVLDDVTQLEKILVPDIAASPRFVFDDGRRCPLHSVYYIVANSIDGKLLAAILNSKPIEFLIRMRAPIVKDGFNRYRRQFLVDLPIPEIDAIAASQILRAAAKRDLEAIDAAAERLFDLSESHMRIINRHLSRIRYRRSEKDKARDSAA